MQTFITIIHVFVAVMLIGVVLLQSGRGGGMGAALGGASSQVFGGRGAGNFLSRVTSIAAVIFFLTSFTLSMMGSRHRSVMADAKAEPPPVKLQQPSPTDPAPTPTGTPIEEPAPTGTTAAPEAPAQH